MILLYCSVPERVPVRRQALHPAGLALRRTCGLRGPFRRAQLPRLQAHRRRPLREPALHLAIAHVRWNPRLPLGTGREELP